MTQFGEDLRSLARGAHADVAGRHVRFSGGSIDIDDDSGYLLVDLRGVGPTLTPSEARSLGGLLIAAAVLAEGGRL